LTAKHQITPTSRRYLSAWQPNPGRGSTYRSGKTVQTTGSSSGGAGDATTPNHYEKTLTGTIQPVVGEKAVPANAKSFSLRDKNIVIISGPAIGSALVTFASPTIVLAQTDTELGDVWTFHTLLTTYKWFLQYPSSVTVHIVCYGSQLPPQPSPYLVYETGFDVQFQNCDDFNNTYRYWQGQLPPGYYEQIEWVGFYWDNSYPWLDCNPVPPHKGSPSP
jgi:hypothetical protein